MGITYKVNHIIDLTFSDFVRLMGFSSNWEYKDQTLENIKQIARNKLKELKSCQINQS